MLGTFVGFPEKTHYSRKIKSIHSKKEFQHILLKIFKRINNQFFQLDEIAAPSINQCVVLFDGGLAENDVFNFLDEEEMVRVQKRIQTEYFRILDFLWIARYYKIEKGKKNPLKFDYFFIRFVFDKKQTILKVVHEKGPRHLSPQDIAIFVLREMTKILKNK